ncbi:MAG: hypothetical protein WCK32_10195 [Chlorobiaceae bacterium]
MIKITDYLVNNPENSGLIRAFFDALQKLRIVSFLFQDNRTMSFSVAFSHQSNYGLIFWLVVTSNFSEHQHISQA